MSQINAGQMRALLVSGSARSPLLPSVPTFAEAGIPFDVSTCFGIFAPAGTPKEIVAKLRDGVQKVLKMPGMAEKLRSLGLEPLGLTGKEFKTFAVADLTRWTKIAKAIDFQIYGQ